jgi:hypothetical protein
MEEQVAEHVLWKESVARNEEELESISEGLEKYVMTKIYEK